MKKLSKCGVYYIRNEKNGKIYVGASSDMFRRINAHRNVLKRNESCNFYLQKDWNKYKEDSFNFGVLERVSEDRLVEREEIWILKLKSCKRSFGYNVSVGVKHSEKTKRKISKANKGQVPWLKGKTGVYSQGTLKLKSSKAKEFYKKNPDFRKKRADDLKNFWENPKFRKMMSEKVQNRLRDEKGRFINNICLN